jgi:hypothetical protein
VSGNAQDGWFVDESEQAVRGEPVRYDRVCVGARTHERSGGVVIRYARQ